jgi:hypothetical protein
MTQDRENLEIKIQEAAEIQEKKNAALSQQINSI